MQHSRFPRLIFTFAALALLIVPAKSRADDLFQLSASSSTTTVNAGGSSLLNLVQNLSNNTQQFAPLKNQTFNSSLNYAGISNAFKFQQSFDSSSNRLVNVQVPSTGLNKTFSSANGSLDSQIRDYLKKDGLADLTAFQAVVDRSSIAGIVDGNPLAATAMLQDAGYQEFALHESPMDLNGKRFTTDSDPVVSRYWVGGGVTDAGGTSGTYVDLTFATEIHFNDFVGLSLTTPLRYETLKSASIYMGGAILGVPITILPAKGGLLSWTITPAGHAAAVGSEDFVSGGLLYGGQINSSFSLSLAGFTLTLADEAGYYHGANLDIDGYSFNTQLNQWIYKNGLQLTKAWGNFFVDASGSWTDFSHAAFVPGYFTPELGIGFKFGTDSNCGFRVGYVGNFGNNYDTNGGNILLYFSR